MSSSMSKKKIEALMTMALAVLTTMPPAVAGQSSPGVASTATNLTLHNLCPYPVWPLVTANAGVPSVPTDRDGEPAGGRLDGHGEGLATLASSAPTTRRATTRPPSCARRAARRR